MAAPKHSTVLTFALLSSSPDSSGPRLGQLTITRPHQPPIQIPTPNLTTPTHRGLVPHLPRDTLRLTPAQWLDVPFESFLEHAPPAPTRVPGARALARFLGHEEHVVCMALRDPADTRAMPANAAAHVSALCLRGVRKCTPDAWRDYVEKCDPDVVLALPDVPHTPGAPSQKRTTKSMDRGAAWLAHLLRPLPSPPTTSSTSPSADADTDPAASAAAPAHAPRLNVLVHMAGGAVPAARAAFARALLDELDGTERAALAPLRTLDAGVAGYAFDLAPLRAALAPSPPAPAPGTALGVRNAQMNPTPAAHPRAPAAPQTAGLAALLRASLGPLPKDKPRVLRTPASPHEILRLVQAAGGDLFDAHAAQAAADVGVAFDFVFPVGAGEEEGKDVGHNLYDVRYVRDFAPFADGDAGADDARPRCGCMACAPPGGMPPHTRAYVHHLLHTHEMGAHALLAAHNLSVLSAMFGGVRRVLAERPGDFAAEVEQFCARYDEACGVIDRAREDWASVEMARGRGRMAREREKELATGAATGAELLDE